jgi:hypothetical protein
MSCEQYQQLKRNVESIANEIRLFKTPFGAGGTKKERDKALQLMNEEKQQAFTALAKHEQSCPECQRDSNE